MHIENVYEYNGECAVKLSEGVGTIDVGAWIHIEGCHPVEPITKQTVDDLLAIFTIKRILARYKDTITCTLFPSPIDHGIFKNVSDMPRIGSTVYLR